MKDAYYTALGKTVIADSLDYLESMEDNSIDLVMTSPPFALLREKEYGNESQDKYVNWLSQFGEVVYRKLKPTGSLVLDIGGAYKKGVPVRNLYPFRVLIKFCDDIGFHLAEDFYWFNSSKLPSPIEWVNKRKIRVKDSVNNVWWFSKTEHPKADVTNVLAPYSDRMLKLLDDPEKYFTAKERPSGHSMSHNFKDNGGAIPPNLLQIPNSESNSNYLSNCKKAKLKGHPARFPSKLPEFFIKFLTEEGDLVVDIFGGSNTTGFVSEHNKRKWLSIEMDKYYAAMSSFRFIPSNFHSKDLIKIYYAILSGQTINLEDFLSNRNVNDKLVGDFLELEYYSLLELDKLNKKNKKYKAEIELAIEVFDLVRIEDIAINND
jgi:site-specific DNA-methyltransferase (cytosine-N4-specific)